MWAPLNFADRVFIAKFKGQTEVGHYSIGVRIASAMVLLLTAFRGKMAAPVTIVEADMTSTLEALALRHATEAARRTAVAWSDRSEAAELIARNPTLWSASEGFRPAIQEGLGAWMRAIVDDDSSGGRSASGNCDASRTLAIGTSEVRSL